MKLLLVILATVASATSALEHNVRRHLDYLSSIPEISEEAQEQLQKIFAIGVLSNFVNPTANIHGQPRIPIIPPPQEDMIEFKDLRLKLSNESGISNWVHGLANFCGFRLTGLSTILNDLAIKPGVPGFNLKLELNAGPLSLEGKQEIGLQFFRSNNFISSGDFWITINKISIFVDMNAILFPKINITSLTTGITNFNLSINFGNTTLQNTTLSDSDWAGLSTTFTTLIPWVYENLLKSRTDPIIHQLVHDLLKDCNVIQLVLGEYSCIGIGNTKAFSEMLTHEVKQLATLEQTQICPAETVTKPPDEIEVSSTSDPGDSGSEAMSKSSVSVIVAFMFFQRYLQY